MYQQYDGGWVEVICGCMFSGKTEELIRRVKRAQIARQKVQVFQHALDRRYGEHCVASHSGANLDATMVAAAGEIAAQVQPDSRVVAIDEVQFFDGSIAGVCNELAESGVRVIVAGLDMAGRGE